MKSRPMIFSAPMVRALLAGQKTQTRRVVKGLTPDHQYNGFLHILNDKKMSGEAWFSLRPHKALNTSNLYVKCPYGMVGDRLWVRETYAHLITDQCPWRYKATDDTTVYDWKSSMFMPRAASRIELEITGIRVEQVQDITDADALAEGINYGAALNHIAYYADLWDVINGKKHPWSDNPWVWVVEFKVVKS